MKPVKLFKVLANESRLQILRWLRDPTRHFGEFLADHKRTHANPHSVGICVQLIQRKSGLSQSTVSQFLSMLQDVDLIQATRIGQWTYYKRNEAKIAEIANLFAKEI